jgi:hypothetical protein
MTMRWIRLVPSQIWVIVDRVAVPQVNVVLADGVPARIQHAFRGCCRWLSW